MNFFPTKEYSLQYVSSHAAAISFLKENTLVSSSLSSQRTAKLFIGTIHETGFTLVSSKIGIGAFAVLKAELTGAGASLKIEINKPFRILACFMILFMAAAVVFEVVRHFEWKTLGLILPVLMFYIFWKFYLRNTLKRSAKVALQRLQPVLVIANA